MNFESFLLTFLILFFAAWLSFPIAMRVVKKDPENLIAFELLSALIGAPLLVVLVHADWPSAILSGLAFPFPSLALINEIGGSMPRIRFNWLGRERTEKEKTKRKSIHLEDGITLEVIEVEFPEKPKRYR